MNWRRLIVAPEAQTRNGSNLCQRSGGGRLGFRPMSALGQKQTCAVQLVMSALSPKADMCSALANVCYGPKADILLRRPLLDRQGSSFCAGVTSSNLVPIDHVPPCLQIVSASVLIFEIIGMFPYVIAKQRALTVHERCVLICLSCKREFPVC